MSNAVVRHTTDMNKHSSFRYVLFGIQNEFQVATKQNKDNNSTTHQLSAMLSVVFLYKISLYLLRAKNDIRSLLYENH